MANGDVQLGISDSYLQQYGLSIGVSASLKLQSFPFLQQLGYNGQLGYMKNDFHGLKDFNAQMAKYSTAHWILTIAWKLISAIVPNNAQLLKLLFSLPGLGQVGRLFQQVHNFGAVFSLSQQDLANSATLSIKVSTASSQALSLAQANTLHV